MVKKLIIIILLLTLILSPRIIFGVRSEKLARQAAKDGDFMRAAEEFELAEHRLFWRDDLWDEIGRAKLLSGQKTDALAAYEKARNENMLSAFGWDILGKEQWEHGDHEEALSLWNEGLIHHPAYFEFYSRLAMVYREEGDVVAERDSIRHWLAQKEETSESAPFHYRLGLLLILTSSEEALDELILAARLDEKFAPVVETLRASLNLALLEGDPAESMILLGRGLALAGEWQLAGSAFYNATQAYPENASAWAWLGETKQHLEEDALPDLDKALDLQPDSALVRSLRGLYWQRQGNLTEALREFQTVAALEPENPNWKSALGEIYARSGDLPSALKAYKQATALATNDPLYWHLLALFSVQYAVQMEEIGLPAAQKAIDLHPKEAAFVDTLGWVYFGLERDEDAEEQFLQALELDPDLSAAHLHLGMLYLKGNHLDLAHQSLLCARDLSQGTLVEKQAAELLTQYFQE